MGKTKGMSRKSLRILLILAAVAVLAIGSRLMVWNGGHDGSSAAIGGPFTLIDGDGNTVTDQTYHGRWLLLYFGYTFCPDVCPTSLGVVAAAMDKLPPDMAAKLTPTFITVDPERDTPDVMKDYVAAFHPSIIGLTGSPEQIVSVMKAYKVYAKKVPTDDPTVYTMDHSSILYLINPDGKFVDHYAHGVTSDDLAASLAKHLR